ncbi:MAG: hypothetical protein ABW156_05410 [Jiangellaceae bacterium]
MPPSDRSLTELPDSRTYLATQAINRGMRIEAIAAMLGHRTLRMTLIYARIANPVVAEEYHSVSERVDALYADPDLPAGETRPCGSCAKNTAGCSATAGAPTRSTSTAPSRPPAKAAASSPPPSSFGPPCKPNTTTQMHDQPSRAELYQRLLDTVDQANR